MARQSGDRPVPRTEFGHRLSAALASAAVRTGGPPLESRDVGNALLFHPRGFVDSRALTFAAQLAADPQHTLVVLDLPASPAETVWETLARALDRRGDSFRLVLGRGTREDVKRTAQWLADRLGRLVLAPDGAVLPAAGGALFIPAENGLGWLRYRPNSSSHPDSRRFPKPQWEFSVPDRVWPTGAGGMVEPLPGGVWIRGTWENAAVGAATHRQQLVDLLVGNPDLIAVAIGSPGTSALPLEEISAFWNTLPTSARPLVRFIPFGPVAIPDGAPLGQALADLLGQRIAVYAGIPAPGADGHPAEMRTLQRNGALGWRPYADEFGFTPRSYSGGSAMPPVPLNTRVPVGAISAVAPGVYQYAADVVLEIVQSGLWVRPPTEPRDGHAVRSAPADPAYPVVLYEDSDPMAADRMRFTAYELLRGLDPSFGERSRIVPASEAGRFPDGYPLPMAGPALTGSQGASLAAAGQASGRVLADPATGQGALPPSSGDRDRWTDESRQAPPAGPAHGPEPVPRWESSAPPVAGPLTSQPDSGGPGWQSAAPPTARPVSGPDVPAAPTVAARDAAPQTPRPPAPPAPGPPVPPSVPTARDAVPQVPPSPAPPAPVPPAPTAPPPPSEPADPSRPQPPVPIWPVSEESSPPEPVASPSPSAADPTPTVLDLPLQPDAPAPTSPARTDPQPAAATPGFAHIRLEASTPEPVVPRSQSPAGSGSDTGSGLGGDTGPGPGPEPGPGVGPGAGPRPEPAAA
ncbi:hypothetical protein ABZ656_52695, partial [Streptomyces sp. NPDC007095]|uniref:hypothetical protein n=1 Tax=Streptomyces sp. NPDC007095 TaxID=3154482 RepID=UPI0033C83AB8